MTREIALVLSSGGARGLAHIGVIEELEQAGFKIKSVAGSSMGALVGGIYATGKLKECTEWICSLDRKSVFSLFDFTISSTGLVKGQKVLDQMQQIIPDLDIEDLQVNFCAVATDIKNQEEMVFEKGSLLEAIRASISIPGVFIPYKSDRKILVDGGVINPLPLNHVKRSKNSLLVAVDVNAPFQSHASKPKKNPELQNNHELKLLEIIRERSKSHKHQKNEEEQYNYYQLLSLSAQMMLQQITRLTMNLYPPHLLIQIPMNSFGTFHFYKAKEIIETGRMAARKAIAEFSNKQLH
jgi:NTE family protein